jgi:hypothetical protein
MKNASMSPSDRPPRLALALSIALLLVSIGAVALQHLGLCGACPIGRGPWTFVAPLGVLGYGVLTAVGCFGPRSLFPGGAAVAAGVHTVLVVAMLTGGQVCPLCVVAATLAVGLFLVMLGRSTSRAKMVACVYLPAVILASVPAAWALAHERTAESAREDFVRTLRGPGVQDRLTIQVFEQDHCGYCRDFREFYLPRLEREFSNRVQVRFLPATATTWVRRTPTIVIEGGSLYEGLPENYLALRLAVEHALALRK